MSHNSSPFRRRNLPKERPSSPQALFFDLPKSAVQYLWAHQDELLRLYHERHLGSSDIALELPTGTGKTLVGLLIGEFRRQSFNDRVLYLCPTRQLAHQIGEQAAGYGIRAHVLVGSKHDFDRAKFMQYANARAIAIATYSGLFNTNPAFANPTTIIVDDAHSAEGYVSSLWSVRLDRSQLGDQYFAVLDLLDGVVPPGFSSDLRWESAPVRIRTKIDCAPLPLLYPLLSSLRGLLDQQLSGTTESWSWSMIRDHLHACHLYVGWDAMVLRCAIPPTHTHEPFCGAQQRVYMSATIGERGELERAFGVDGIERLPVPTGWEQHSSGRRFILFPDLSLEHEDVTTLLCQSTELEPRTLALCPNGIKAEELRERLSSCKHRIAILDKSDVEQSMSRFSESDDVLLLLTSRYDGIDLPGDTCHLEVIYGEPSALDPQERFLLSRLGAHELLRDLIRTRISQALGRCVRGPNDYALVLLIGDDLCNFCCNKENILGLHPETQAEFEFGIECSFKQSPETLLEMMKLFLSQSEKWEEAEDQIIRNRAEKVRLAYGAAERLGNAVCSEVYFFRHLWAGDYGRAQKMAQTIVDLLEGPELAPYRGWWYYLAGCVAWLRHEVNGEPAGLPLARDLFTRAASAAPAISWLVRLQRMCGLKDAPASEVDLSLALAAESAYAELNSVPRQGKKFEAKMSGIRALLEDTQSRAFEEGLTALGRLLGYRAQLPSDESGPDSVWSLPGFFHLVFEAKSQHTPKGRIGKKDVLQSKGHLNWLRTEGVIREGESVFAIIVSPRMQLHRAALPQVQANDLYHQNLEEIRTLGDEAIALHRHVRALTSDTPEEAIRKVLLQELVARRLAPKSIATRLTSRLVSDLDVAD